MKRLIPFRSSNDEGVVTVNDLGLYCNYCNQTRKQTASPLGMQVFICRDCAVQIAKILKKEEPIDGQVDTNGVPF